jgi:hypothetical protein
MLWRSPRRSSPARPGAALGDFASDPSPARRRGCSSSWPASLRAVARLYGPQGVREPRPRSPRAGRAASRPCGARAPRVRVEDVLARREPMHLWRLDEEPPTRRPHRKIRPARTSAAAPEERRASRRAQAECEGVRRRRRREQSRRERARAPRESRALRHARQDRASDAEARDGARRAEGAMMRTRAALGRGLRSSEDSGRIQRRRSGVRRSVGRKHEAEAERQRDAEKQSPKTRGRSGAQRRPSVKRSASAGR